MINRKNIPLYIALAVPVIMIAVVALLVYLPSGFIHPSYRFVYSSGGDYPYNEYVVHDRHLEKNPPAPNDPYAQRYAAAAEPQLFIYDPVKNESREASLDEATGYVLDPTTQSPDGYEVSQGNSDGGIFEAFFGGNRDYSARYLVGHHGSKKMNLKSVAGSYYDPYSFRFLGWITQ